MAPNSVADERCVCTPVCMCARSSVHVCVHASTTPCACLCARSSERRVRVCAHHRAYRPTHSLPDVRCSWSQPLRMVLRSRYAMSGTETGYDATHCPVLASVWWYAVTMPCPVLTSVWCYQAHGQDPVAREPYRHTVCPYALVLTAVMVLHIRYAESHTNIRYVLYAGTEIRYGATRYASVGTHGSTLGPYGGAWY